MRSVKTFFFKLSLGVAVLAPLSMTSYAQQKPAQPAAAAAPASAGTMAGLRVAVVDIQAAILQTEQGKVAKGLIEKEAEGKRKEILDMQNELKKLDEDFQKQQAVLSEDAKAAKMREFQTRMENLRKAQLNFEQEVRKKEQEETQKIYQNLDGLISQLAKEKGYDLVFEKGAGALIYAAKVDDITGDLVKQYNSMHKVSKK